MLGAIIGDIIGSRFEFNPIKTTEFELFGEGTKITDDTAMTVAVMEVLLQWQDMGRSFVPQNEDEFHALVIATFKKYYQKYPDGDYGLGFIKWLESDNPQPYFSYGNGACMRISPCAYLNNLGDAGTASVWVTEVSHNHPISHAWVDRLVRILFKLRQPSSWEKEDVRYYFNTICEVEGIVPLTLEELRPVYEFDETCQGTVPAAIQCVLEADSFEDAMRNAVSLGGDADTLCAIAGPIAELLYGIPADIKFRALNYLPGEMAKVVLQFQEVFGR